MTNHNEAFKLMQYQDENDKCGVIEWIWNSRDGVTPFIVASKKTGDSTFLNHINWQDDILALQYVPNVGQRVFVDLTEERAREYLTARIERQWSPKGSKFWMSDRWETKEAAFKELFETSMQDVERHAPDVVVCTRLMQNEFAAQREVRRGALPKLRNTAMRGNGRMA